MKQGRTLAELAAEIERQDLSKVDFKADTRNLELIPPVTPDAAENRGMVLKTEAGEFEMLESAHRQIGARLEIPRKYYEKMRGEYPALLSQNVNAWFRKNPERRMIRTLGGDARAFLSDRYRIIDHIDVLNHVLPVLLDDFHSGALELQSCEVTPSKMYLKATFPKVKATVRAVGEEVSAGFTMGNSEIGDGSVFVYPFVMVLSCTNGATWNKAGFRRYHVGRRTGNGEDETTMEIYRPETVEADNAALLMKIGDVVRACADEQTFREKIVSEMDRAAGVTLEAEPAEILERAGAKFGLSEDEGKRALTELVRYGDLYGGQSLFSLAQAVTRVAHDEVGELSYDRATELESIGGVILQMPSARELVPVAVAH